MNRMEMQEELKEVNNYLIKVQKDRSRIILGVLLGEVLQLRKHVQKLIKESEIDEPMLDTIHKTLKDLEEAMMLEM